MYGQEVARNYGIVGSSAASRLENLYQEWLVSAHLVEDNPGITPPVIHES